MLIGKLFFLVQNIELKVFSFLFSVKPNGYTKTQKKNGGVSSFLTPLTVLTINIVTRYISKRKNYDSIWSPASTYLTILQNVLSFSDR